MNYTLNILLDSKEKDEIDTEEIEEEKYDINMLLLDKECQLSIIPRKNLKECFKDQVNYQHMIKELYDMLKIYINEGDKNTEELYRNFIEFMKKTPINEFYSNFNNVFLKGSLEQIIEFINNTPEIKDKNLVIMNTYPLSEEGYKTATKDLKEIFDKTNVKMSIVIEGNQEATTIEEFKSVFDYIDKIVDEIKSLNLSELEQIMYAYDIVRNRVYTEEEKDDLASASRNLKSIILGNKIVCAGYAIFFNTILEKLNIKCTKYHLDSMNKNESGHARSLVYVEDKKYAVKGLYFFDPTFDSKSEEDNENEFLNTYYTFAKTAGDFNYIDNKQELIPQSKYLIPKNYKELLDNLNDIITPDEIIRTKAMKGVNPILNLLGKNDINYFMYSMKSKEEFNEFYIELVRLANRHISLNKIAELVYNVKKVEYYVHPELYKLDMASIKKAIDSYFKFSPVLNAEERLLCTIFGKTEEELLEDKYNDALEKISEEEIERIKLTRTLRKILQNK